MITIEIHSPTFKVLLHKNVHALDQASLKLGREGWYPVGGVGRKGNDWVQVMVKENGRET